MKLTPDEQAMADGRRGPVLAFASGAQVRISNVGLVTFA